MQRVDARRRGHPRRYVLKTVFGGGLTGLIAGCTGGGEGQTPTANQSPTASGCPDPPDKETDPKTLLPEVPSGWTRTKTHGEAAGMVGAEVGITGIYQNQNGGEYQVETLRWPSEKEAEDGVKMYRGSGDQTPQVWLVFGRFTFAVSGPNQESARTLLAASPALTADCVESRLGIDYRN